MTIKELIEQGNIAAKSCKQPTYDGDDFFYSGPAYEHWINLAIRYLDINFPGELDNVRFRDTAIKANGNGDEYFQTLIGILRAYDTFPATSQKNDIDYILESICMNFNKFEINIKRRHSNRTSISIDDEYDVQDSLYAILRLFVSDIRPEDYVPSYAGANSRVDYLLPEHRIVIETKMTNSNLKDKQVGEQLIIDINRYKQLEGYNKLVCFVYDKESYIHNPAGLKSDLEKLSEENFKVIVYISPV
jgi:hypothetical protein